MSSPAKSSSSKGGQPQTIRYDMFSVASTSGMGSTQSLPGSNKPTASPKTSQKSNTWANPSPKSNTTSNHQTSYKEQKKILSPTLKKTGRSTRSLDRQITRVRIDEQGNSRTVEYDYPSVTMRSDPGTYGSMNTGGMRQAPPPPMTWVFFCLKE